MIFLNKQDIASVAGSLYQQAVKEAYRMMRQNEYNMPDRMHVGDKENMLLLMPCFSERFFATKLVSVFPEAGTYGQPAVNGIVTLCDNRSGQPLALFDAAELTAQRTGAVGGLAIDCLAPATVGSAGIFGAGVQAMSQARYLMLNRDIARLYVCSRSLETASTMIDRLAAEFPDTAFLPERDPWNLVEKSEVIIAATTSSTPLFEAEPGRLSGKTFISVGSFRPDMQEFPDAVARAAGRVWVDTRFAMEESGDVAFPLERKIIGPDQVGQFADIVDSPPAAGDRAVFFKSVGMALFDLAAASAVYRLAVKQDFGQKLDTGQA